MSELFKIIYIDPCQDDSPAGVPKEIEALREYAWARCPRVGWFVSGRIDFKKELPSGDMVVLQWPDDHDSHKNAEKVFNHVRDTHPKVPVLLALSAAPDPRPFFEAQESVPQVEWLSFGDLEDDLAVEKALKKLNVVVPLADVTIEYDSDDLEMVELIHWLNGEDSLALIIQKYFPNAKKVEVSPVGGGWSGKRLCRICIKDSYYYLKFFPEPNDFVEERKNHAKSKKFLGKAWVGLMSIPKVAKGFQIQAFPLRGRPYICPVCYRSASETKKKRNTLKSIYRSKDEYPFLEQAFLGLISILKAGQKACPPKETSPWLKSNLRWSGDVFPWSHELRVEVGSTLQDLHDYGEHMCRDWKSRSDALKVLLYGPLPSWLKNRKKVLLGHIHGDPNPRNCLVPEDDPTDIQIIDCGDYTPKGRLVSDLAIIERDIKMVLMATEKKVDQFYDLDTRRLPSWCKAESESIQKGLDYRPNDSPVPLKKTTDTSTQRAYRLVGLVRERAKEVSGDWDPKGIHYFAALLYWTLHLLQYPGVRQTKKLLALYSAAEILMKFSKQGS